MAVDPVGIKMEDRTCAVCGRTFRVMAGSSQLWCSDFCRRKDSYTAKWKMWHQTMATIERFENGGMMGNGRVVDGCVKCGRPMLTANRMGTCTQCRTVTCAYHGCKNTLVLRGAAGGYCRDHAYKTKKRENEYYL
jgi:hypothetical protein